MLNIMVILFSLFLIALCAGAAWYFLGRKKLPVLMYHHVGPVLIEDQEEFYITPEMFEEQIKYLLSKGYSPISFEEMENAITNNSPLPAKPVLITFDDGWEDNYTQAFPILKKYKTKANIFLNAAQMGQELMLSWKQIKEMQDSGLIGFASHGMNHKRLRSLSDQEVIYELNESKKILEEKLNKKILSFAYPYGAADYRIRNMVKQAGFIIDHGTRRGIFYLPWFGLFPVKRVHMMRGETLTDFNLQLAFGRKKI